MDYYLQGGFWVILGTVAVGSGGLLLTLGWNVWPKKTEKTKWYRRKGVDFIIRGSLLVALGGLSATFGWNVISLGEQRGNLVRAVVHESAVNNTDINKARSGPVYYFEEEEGKKLCIINMFPTLSTSALNAVLTSGLFDLRKPDDSEFFITVLNYKRALGTANKIFDIFNDNIVKMGSDTPDRRITQARKFRNMTRKSPWGKNLYEQDQNMKGLLHKKYRDVVDELLGKKPQDKVQSQEKSPTIEPQEEIPKP